MGEDMKKILKMVQDGKITADEASVLIDALKNKNESISNTTKSKKIKIYVYDKIQDKKKVDITIPIVLAKSFLKFGLKFIPKDKIAVHTGKDGFDIDNLDEIIKAIENGAQGTLVDVDEENERVIIKVE
jgi:hypothetical protein